ncbi:hypothetical protein [Fictibacillus sp. KU28468]|uniref:hypothetical protein n=1 Tax=Fictibacillus sp. KU28468 TaxID=2991053 RepID=UPI00223D5C97|nr:hypothetical protein [Fictibacillus sp. KU28468]UZJ79580.1 hypothetical protein OKX00_03610 [Fictibacillus sp. KU28468]
MLAVNNVENLKEIDLNRFPAAKKDLMQHLHQMAETRLLKSEWQKTLKSERITQRIEIPTVKATPQNQEQTFAMDSTLKAR